jgi:hypothetical protein
MIDLSYGKEFNELLYEHYYSISEMKSENISLMMLSSLY